MIKKALRLTKNEIEYILKKGSQSTSKLFIIRHSEARQGFPRFCVIVSKKVANKATARNRIRRRIYEAIRQSNQNSVNPGQDLVLIAKKSIIDSDYHSIFTDINSTFSQIHG